MIRTRIARKYGHAVRYTRRVHWVAGSYSFRFGLFRGMGNQISGHVIDTQCNKVMIFIYSSRFVENTDVPHMHTGLVDRLTHLTRYDPLFNRIYTIRHFMARFSQAKSHYTTRITREIPWLYVKFHCENSTVQRVSRVNCTIRGHENSTKLLISRSEINQFALLPMIWRSVWEQLCSALTPLISSFP